MFVPLTAIATLAFCVIFADHSWAQVRSTSQSRVVKRSDWSGQPKYRPGELLVRFRPGTRSTTIDAAHAEVGAHVSRSWNSVQGLQLVGLPAQMKLKDAIRTYRKNPNVLYVEPNYIVHALVVPNDPDFSQQWSLQNTGQSGGVAGADIHTTQAWNLTTGSSSVVVAVIDTGIDYNHPDLAANMWRSFQMGSRCSCATITPVPY